jgi:hypothetical protein
VGQIQACSFCRKRAIALDGPIYVDPERNERAVLVAECPRCRRWLCNAHGEPLSGRVTEAERTLGLAALGCPFDYDVLLGCEDSDPDG